MALCSSEAMVWIDDIHSRKWPWFQKWLRMWVAVAREFGEEAAEPMRSLVHFLQLREKASHHERAENLAGLDWVISPFLCALLFKDEIRGAFFLSTLFTGSSPTNQNQRVIVLITPLFSGSLSHKLKLRPLISADGHFLFSLLTQS